MGFVPKEKAQKEERYFSDTKRSNSYSERIHAKDNLGKNDWNVSDWSVKGSDTDTISEMSTKSTHKGLLDPFNGTSAQKDVILQQARNLVALVNRVQSSDSAPINLPKGYSDVPKGSPGKSSQSRNNPYSVAHYSKRRTHSNVYVRPGYLPQKQP